MRPKVQTGTHGSSSSASLAESFKEISLGSDKRRGALRQAKMMEFRGHGPYPAPDWIPHHAYGLFSDGLQVASSFNAPFECIWLPWAQEVKYHHHRDVAMVCCFKTSFEGHHLKDLANKSMSWAIPTRPVLEYMISWAPDCKIAEIMATALATRLPCSRSLEPMWSRLATIDNFFEKNPPSPVYFPETIFMDGEEFIKHGGANGHTPFFCWPRKDDPLHKASLTEACKTYKTFLTEAYLNVFHGDTMFFVGKRRWLHL